MAFLGRYNKLRIVKRADIGAFLDGDQFGDILLPRKYAPESMRIGDKVEVFLYNDSEDRIIATTLAPRVQVGKCAYLKVVATGKYGAFLDWGLPKDLLVPFSEQQNPMQKGYSYTVYVFVDEETQRIAASTKLEQHLSVDVSGFKPRQQVDLLIYGKSDLGFKAVINGTHLGQLFEGETFQRLHFGEQVKVDLVLQLPSELTRDSLGAAIIDHLRNNEGVSTLTDKSPPDDIYRTFGVSKASYKKALGQLYRQRMIMIEKHQITLL
jgi:predicted RNA-binding protein (virulence factor B family)